MRNAKRKKSSFKRFSPTKKGQGAATCNRGDLQKAAARRTKDTPCISGDTPLLRWVSCLASSELSERALLRAKRRRVVGICKPAIVLTKFDIAFAYCAVRECVWRGLGGGSAAAR